MITNAQRPDHFVARDTSYTTGAVNSSAVRVLGTDIAWSSGGLAAWTHIEITNNSANNIIFGIGQDPTAARGQVIAANATVYVALGTAETVRLLGTQVSDQSITARRLRIST